MLISMNDIMAYCRHRYTTSNVRRVHLFDTAVVEAHRVQYE